MKTMYRAENRIATDCEGRYYDWRALTEYTTEELAREATKVVSNKFPANGDWRIVARTIDEEAFTVTDETIAEFDWWKEVGKREEAKHMMTIYAKRIEEAEAIKAKTEKGLARKEKMVAEARKYYEEYKAVAEKA